MAERDVVNEVLLREAMRPRRQQPNLPENSVNGVPVGRRAHPGRDAALAEGRDPLDPLKRQRPAGI